MEKFKSKKGFTMVELLVAMAIIGLLIATAIWGIGIAQQSARNTQRRSTGALLVAGLSEYYSRFNKQAQAVCWVPASNEISFSQGTCAAPVNTYNVTVNSTSTTAPIAAGTLTNDSPLNANGTTAAVTEYVIRTSATTPSFAGTLVCVCMEGGGTANLSDPQGTAAAICIAACP